MSGPYSLEKKAQLAAAIDVALGTDESDNTVMSTTDLLLGWMTAAVKKISDLDAQVTTLQKQMGKVIAGG